MMENTIAKIQSLAGDQDYVAKVTNADSAEEMLTVMAEYGIQLTVEELHSVLNQIIMPQEDGELDEDMLKNVSGGGRVWNWVKSCFNKWFQRQSEKNAREIGYIINDL